MMKHYNGQNGLLLLACTVLTMLHAAQGIEPFSVSRILAKRDKARAEARDHEHYLQYQDHQDTASATDDDHVKELYLNQRLDHFASHPKKDPFTFSQRYFYSDIFIHKDEDTEERGAHNLNLRGNSENENAKTTSKTKFKATPPTYAFLCVGGEGPAFDKTVLTNSVHCSGDMMETAKELFNERGANVHLFALEHRYYGKSYPSFGNNEDGSPSSPVSNENLVYLSSRQALADIAHFVEFAREEYLATDVDAATDAKVPFVTFGGSYPGMLAAWSRLKYPHLIYAAVSNSAPIEVILDFTGYKDVVARDFANEMVGGSAQCLDVVQKAHEELANVLYGSGSDDDNDNESNLERIASLFQICGGTDDLRDEKSVRSFLGDGVVFLDVQSNDPSCDRDFCNIEKFCNFLTEESSRLNSTPMEAMGKLTQKMLGDSCTNISWEDMIEYYSGSEAPMEERSWLWQTCTEVGFYQTCEYNSTCPFGKGYHTLEADYELCERAFGIDAALVKENVDDTLNYYGGWNIESSRILSVNGDIDPWSAMSYSNSGREDGKINDMDSYWSIGASHHFWTHDVKDSDGLGIMKTREFIHSWVIDMLDKIEVGSDAEENMLSIE